MERIDKGKAFISFFLIQFLIVTNLFFYSFSFESSCRVFSDSKNDSVYQSPTSTVTGHIFDSNQLNNIPSRLLENLTEKKGNFLPIHFEHPGTLQQTNLAFFNRAVNQYQQGIEVSICRPLFKLYCSLKIPLT